MCGRVCGWVGGAGVGGSRDLGQACGGKKTRLENQRRKNSIYVIRIYFSFLNQCETSVLLLMLLLLFVVCCWVLGVGCWVLGVVCWVLGVGCWVLLLLLLLLF